MVIKKCVTNLFPRPLVFCLIAVWGLTLVLLWFSDIREAPVLARSLLVFHQLVLIFAVVMADWATAAVTLTSDGVRYRGFFFRRQHLWTELRQVGIIECKGRGYRYWAYVLVPEKGVLHTSLDVGDEHVSFKMNGIGKNIYFPVSEQAGDLISRFYGALDFNLRED